MSGDDNNSISLSFLIILNKKFLMPRNAKRKSRGSSTSSLSSKNDFTMMTTPQPNLVPQSGQLNQRKKGQITLQILLSTRLIMVHLVPEAILLQ